ncbi:MAG: M3 family metallopeptidase [Synechococcus sp. SB0666_bin_14]|nr:M3 family metallopeptidase [Synechococcus sp. SB0666_bin_14]MYA90980.1 M3 family metallopeptidase [Synechococcus sp. SB0663_bin_10]MYG47712.1 M3 family metallopeptidase [Synechococcus sp. SB0675_bin_6]MYJ59676.1 M3 family metallopeptidase [Synechococcus sp. SB0672_bin_6]
MTSTTNPLLLGHGLPPYGQFTPEAIGAGMPELLQHLEAALARHEARLTAMEDPTWEQVMDPLHHVEERLRWAWGVVNHLTGVCDSNALRQVYSQQQPAVVDFYNRLGQSEPLYKALRQLQQRHRQGLLPLDGVQQRIVTTAVQAMELQGVGLEPEQRQAFNAASTRLAELSTSYSNHVLDATKAWSLLLKEPGQVDGLPESLRELMAAAAREAGHGEATAAAGPWQLGLDLPRYGPFLRYSRHRHLREQAYRAYVSRAAAGDTDNHPLIREILTLRHQQAQRLGYQTWAQVSLVSKMAGSVEEIEQLAEELRRPSQLAAARELEQLGQLAKKMGAPDGERLKPWDVPYWSEQLRRHRFDLDSEALRPWFPLEQVLEGLFGLCERLFAIRILPADGEAPLWHKDVRFFRVVDQEGNTPMAAFYLDPYARPGQKRGGAWMDECLVRQRNHQGQVVVPVAYLVCNQTPPVNGAPSLMTFMEVETLFHEFGHGLQHMLTTVDHPQAAGLNLVEDDAIELASQFMENWCYDQPTVMAMARHWQTGAPLPEAEFAKISAARTFMAGTAMLRQLSFAQGDLELHARWMPDGEESPEATWRRIATAVAALPPIAEDAAICSFEHLFAGGYAAGYYSYKWSEVLSADAFAAFEEVGLANEAGIRTLGRQYRDSVLSLGGSQHAGAVFRTFRGREPSTEALLRHSGLMGDGVLVKLNPS